MSDYLNIIENLILINPGVPSETDGSINCFYCSAWLEHKDHEEDCPYIQVIEFLKNKKNEKEEERIIQKFINHAESLKW